MDFPSWNLGVHYWPMRRKLVLTCAAVLLTVAASSSARATEVGYNRTFWLGFELGNPSGIV